MARPEKIAHVEAVEASLVNAKSIVLSDLTGLNVAKITDLRRRCRAAGVDIKVVKNTLAKRAIKDGPAAGLAKYFVGPTAVAVSRESENGAAKVIAKFAEENELPRLKGGFVDGNVIDAKGVLALSKIPSRKELLSQLLGNIEGPSRNLVSVMQGPLRNLASVLKQASEKQS